MPKTEPKPKLIRPTVHLNGTGANTLLEDYDNAREEVRNALTAIRKIEFNARDYYPQEDGAWDAAVAQMRDRIRALEAISDEFLEIMMHIQDSGK